MWLQMCKTNHHNWLVNVMSVNTAAHMFSTPASLWIHTNGIHLAQLVNMSMLCVVYWHYATCFQGDYVQIAH